MSIGPGHQFSGFATAPKHGDLALASAHSTRGNRPAFLRRELAKFRGGRGGTFAIIAKDSHMRISYFCFIAAALAALTGMTMGIVMGMSDNFTLAPAHAHLNLLGWVTMALYGLYHRGIVRNQTGLAWTQVSLGALGFPVMAGGLGVYLGTGNGAVIPLIIIGAFLCLASMLLFLLILVSDFRRIQANAPTQLSAVV